MWQPSYNRTPRTGSRSQMFNYQDRQIRKDLENQYERITDIESLEGKLKEVEQKHQEVLKKHNEALRGLVDERDITETRKKLVKESKPVEFEKEIINARMDTIRAESEDILNRFGV